MNPENIILGKRNQSQRLDMILFFFFMVLRFELRAYTFSHSQPFFMMNYFQDRVSQTICLGWLRTMILLISAS
jgi:hypothetical protein